MDDGVLFPLFWKSFRRLGCGALAAVSDYFAWNELRPGAVGTLALTMYPRLKLDVVLELMFRIQKTWVQSRLDAGGNI